LIQLRKHSFVLLNVPVQSKNRTRTHHGWQEQPILNSTMTNRIGG